MKSFIYVAAIFSCRKHGVPPPGMQLRGNTKITSIPFDGLSFAKEMVNPFDANGLANSMATVIEGIDDADSVF